jgi:hypothetical protein
MSGISNYQIPSFLMDDAKTKEDRLNGWLREAIQDGQAFLRGQRAHGDIKKALAILSGTDEERIPKSLSKIRPNIIKRQIRDVVATEANIRPLWGYKSDNPALKQQANVLNNCIMAWWLGTFADRSIREALQYAAVLGTGYICPIWEHDFWFAGRGDIRCHVYGPEDVIPVQIPNSNDLQKAYAVIIKTELPIYMVHAMYPDKAHLIKATRERPTSMIQKGLAYVQKWISPVLNLQNSTGGEQAVWPTVDVYQVYVRDLSINTTGKKLAMGKPGTNWAYEVPSLGDDISAEIFDANGMPLYRKAVAEDALLFPNRRLLVATDNAILDDDASPWWHGKVPAIQFRTDDWPWEFLGYSMVHDNASVQESYKKHLRNIDDACAARLRPSLMYDKDLISQPMVERFDPRQPAQHLGVNMSLGDPMKPVLPPQYYDVPTPVWNHMQQLRELMDYQVAANDMAAIAKARQLPSADTIEKILEMAGPITTDISRNMERSLRDLGEICKSLFFQFYTTPRKFQIMGPNGITPEDYDFDPGNMVPGHMPGEDPAQPSKFSPSERARRWQQQFVFNVTPNSLHQITQMTRRLLLLQLQRAGFPIDSWTLAEAMDIPNFGPPPQGTSTVYERWVAEQKLKAELMADMQAEAARSQMATQAAAAVPSMAGEQRGRPPSASAPPRLEVKDQGERSTIAESR